MACFWIYQVNAAAKHACHCLVSPFVRYCRIIRDNALNFGFGRLTLLRVINTDAKGSGPDSAKLHIKPVDLTALAKRNRGRFDPAAVYQMIDGRNARLSHHSAEMPIWGCRHQTPLPTLPATTKRKIPKRILSQIRPHEDELNTLFDLP
jgi:hypothetical protein